MAILVAYTVFQHYHIAANFNNQKGKIIFEDYSKLAISEATVYGGKILFV